MMPCVHTPIFRREQTCFSRVVKFCNIRGITLNWIELELDNNNVNSVQDSAPKL